MLSLVPKFCFAGGNLKTLKIRMNSVRSIKKITKAMKMVAASKMRQEIRRLEDGKNFAAGSVQKIMDNESYLQKKKIQPTIKMSLIIPLTSDKGLCGGINSGIVREVKNTVKHDRNNFKIAVIGEKATQAIVRHYPDILVAAISQIQQPVNFPAAASIAHQMQLLAVDCDQLTLVYNKFKNIVTYQVTKTDILTRPNFLKQFKYVTRHEATEPDLEYAKQYFYELYVGSIFYNAFLNNNAAEQSSRMAAMENASKNAGEMLDKLTLEYNKMRQAKITMELIEIISGASAL